MNLLVDTHALIWWFADDPRLSGCARAAIAEPENRVFVSAASGWEIATKHRIGRFPEADRLLRDLPGALLRDRFEAMAIGLSHGLAAGALPGPHRDPFDRILVAQARLEGLTVVSLDPVFRHYDSDVLW